MDFKESETYKNLQKAYDAERLTSTKYEIYADQARREGYIEIGVSYDQFSDHEKELAKVWLRQMHDGEIPSTIDNLEESSITETYEWAEMFPSFAETAMQEGYPDIARLFQDVAKIDQYRNFRFRQFSNELLQGNFFCKYRTTVWLCLNCGNLYYGECAPEICPVCLYPQGYYIQNCETF